MYDTEEWSADPAPIIPASCLVATVVWEVNADIERASPSEPTPAQCPVGRKYVPFGVRDHLICWAHTSPSSGHPGIGSDSALPCWEVLVAHVSQGREGLFVLLFGVRTVQGTWTPARGKLQPLPIPQRPWSHLSVDFLTDLPPSRGNTTILVIVDRFSKSCRLLPLPGLPTDCGGPVHPCIPALRGA
jgi:hypothetical protein